MKPIHDRMPVILPPSLETEWLDYDLSPEEASAMLVPFEGEELYAYPVSSLVNNVRNNGPEIIAPFREGLF
jgi:putative SOS response-associated peptidase YedK